MPTPTQPPAITILLVHPDPAERQALALPLQDWQGLRLVEAGSGREALDTLRRLRCDAVVCNLELPDFDAWRLARMIRSWEFAGRSGVDVPLVVVGQAVSEHLARQTAQTYGVDGFLPLARRAELADTLRQHLQACASTPSRPRVLVVEDYPETLTLLRRILESRYAVDTAEDGAQALALWQPGRYDLVLLDIMLPRVSGPEVLDRIRLEAPAQPVVIMTANSTLELAELMLLRGATDFVSKPFRAEELRRICELALKHRDYWAITRELDGALPAGASPAAC